MNSHISQDRPRSSTDPPERTPASIEPEQAVEGRPPSRRVRRVQRRVLVPLMIVALAAGAAVTYYYFGGLPAAALGAVLIAMYYLIGWSSEIGAAILRRKSHED